MALYSQTVLPRPGTLMAPAEKWCGIVEGWLQRQYETGQ